MQAEATKAQGTTIAAMVGPESPPEVIPASPISAGDDVFDDFAPGEGVSVSTTGPRSAGDDAWDDAAPDEGVGVPAPPRKGADDGALDVVALAESVGVGIREGDGEIVGDARSGVEAHASKAVNVALRVVQRSGSSKQTAPPPRLAWLDMRLISPTHTHEGTVVMPYFE